MYFTPNCNQEDADLVNRYLKSKKIERKNLAFESILAPISYPFTLLIHEIHLNEGHSAVFIFFLTEPVNLVNRVMNNNPLIFFCVTI